ncbi:MAG: hypothetical protein KAT32_02660 [Candidatus Moranbacteria bacterium]|nr:hypothetical protein [Candidatus Moranbacteria bacterium]
MEDLFLLILLISLVGLFIGYKKPSTLSFIGNGEMTRKKALTLFGSIALVSFVLFGITTDSKESKIEEVVKTEDVSNQENIEKKDNVNKSEKSTEKETDKSTWYEKTYKITTIDKQEGMEDYDVGSINVWPSFDDRSSVVSQLKNNDEISLIGYDSEHDYCKIKKSDKIGWVACPWIVGLSSDMSNYWDN